MILPEFEKDREMRTADLYHHYSDRRFEGGRKHTVFLGLGHVATPTGFGTEEVPRASYIYDDRISGEAYDRARAEVPNDHTAAFFERLVRHTVERDDAEIVHIIAGIDPRTSDPMLVYGYVTPEPQSAA